MPLLNLLLLSTFGDATWRPFAETADDLPGLPALPQAAARRRSRRSDLIVIWRDFCHDCVLDVLNNQENLLAVADWCRHKKKPTHKQNPFFEPTFRRKKQANYYYQEIKTQKMPVQDWVIDEIFRNEKFEVRIPYTTINTNSEKQWL